MWHDLNKAVLKKQPEWLFFDVKGTKQGVSEASERLRRLCACRVVPDMFAQAWESETIGDVRVQALSAQSN